MTMRTVRFRAHEGRLEPLEPVEMVDGSEVDVPIQVQPTRGAPSAVLAAMRELPHIDPSSIDELKRVIKSGRIPVRHEGAFDPEREVK